MNVNVIDVDIGIASDVIVRKWSYQFRLSTYIDDLGRTSVNFSDNETICDLKLTIKFKVSGDNSNENVEKD